MTKPITPNTPAPTAATDLFWVIPWIRYSALDMLRGPVAESLVVVGQWRVEASPDITAVVGSSPLVAPISHSPSSRQKLSVSSSYSRLHLGHRFIDKEA